MVFWKVQEIDFNSLVLILSIYLSERRKMVRLFYPHFSDAYVLPNLTSVKYRLTIGKSSSIG